MNSGHMFGNVDFYRTNSFRHLMPTTECGKRWKFFYSSEDKQSEICNCFAYIQIIFFSVHCKLDVNLMIRIWIWQTASRWINPTYSLEWYRNILFSLFIYSPYTKWNGLGAQFKTTALQCKTNFTLIQFKWMHS